MNTNKKHCRENIDVRYLKYYLTYERKWEWKGGNIQNIDEALRIAMLKIGKLVK